MRQLLTLMRDRLLQYLWHHTCEDLSGTECSSMRLQQCEGFTTQWKQNCALPCRSDMTTEMWKVMLRKESVTALRYNSHKPKRLSKDLKKKPKNNPLKNIIFKYLFSTA